jgi:hypothetical protein
MPKPWLSSQGGVHSQMNSLVLEVVAQKTPLRSRRVLNLCWLHSGNGKRKYFCFYKNKGYRYKDELG